MIVTQPVNPREGMVNRVSRIRTEIIDAVRRPRVGLGVGLTVAALAGAPMPLPELALLGPWIAYLGTGRVGAVAASAVGFASFLLFAHATPLALGAAATIAAFAALGVPAWMEAKDACDEKQDDGASAIMIDCDGFSTLDETYGTGTSAHVFSMLHRALKQETRETDLVVHVQGQEIVLVLDGSSPTIVQAVMARVERRFSAWLADAGYECHLSVGLSGLDMEETEPDGLLRAPKQANRPYMD